MSKTGDAEAATGCYSPLSQLPPSNLLTVALPMFAALLARHQPPDY